MLQHILTRETSVLSGLISSLDESIINASLRRLSTGVATMMAEMRFPYKIKKRAENKVPIESESDPQLLPLERIDPFDVAQQNRLSLHGGPERLTGDPGSVRWTAPYYIPPHLQKVCASIPMRIVPLNNT